MRLQYAPPWLEGAAQSPGDIETAVASTIMSVSPMEAHEKIEAQMANIADFIGALTQRLHANGALKDADVLDLLPWWVKVTGD